jgi:predicted deacylase
VHLHGADYNEELVPFNYYAKTGKKQVDEMSLKITRCFPSKFYLEAVLEEDVTVGAPKGTSYAANARGTLYGEASAKGIPATMAEAGREGKVEDEFVSILCNGVNNVMKLIGMKKGDVFQNTEMKRLHSPILVTNKRGGVFLPKSNIGEFVEKGDELAEIVDLKGDVIEVIRSPTDGMIVDRINFAAADSFPTPRQPYLFYIAKVDS